VSARIQSSTDGPRDIHPEKRSVFQQRQPEVLTRTRVTISLQPASHFLGHETHSAPNRTLTLKGCVVGQKALFYLFSFFLIFDDCFCFDIKIVKKTISLTSLILSLSFLLIVDGRLYSISCKIYGSL
jgi:hypothetical protein